MRRKINQTCACGATFQAVPADIARGWGKTCSKRCAAKLREKTNTPSPAQRRQRRRYAEGKLGGGVRLPANVTREQYESDREEFGGTPQYNARGEYEGFTMSPEELAGGGYGDSYDGDGLAVGEGKDWF